MKTTVIFLVLVLLSCRYKCPEFNTDLFHWVPYHKNDSVTFVLNQDTSMTLIAGEIKVYQTKAIGAMDYCAVCRAGMELDLQTLRDQIHISIWDPTIRSLHCEVTLGYNQYSFFNPHDSTGEYDLSGRHFSDVIFLTSDDYENDSSRIIIAREYGIIMMEINGKKWILSGFRPFDGNIAYARFRDKPC